MAAHFLAAVIFEYRRHKVPLHIWRRAVRHDRPEAATLRIAGCHDTGALAPVLDDRFDHPPCSSDRIADWIGRLGRPARNVIDVILQIASYRGFVERYVNAVLLQMLAGADTGEHQDLRRVECASRQDDSVASLNHFMLAPSLDRHTGDTAIFDNQFLNQSSGTDIEVGLAAQRLYIGARGRPAFAIFLRNLVEAKAFLAIVIEVGIARQLQLRSAFNESCAGGVWPFLVRDRQGPITAVEFITTTNIAFAAFEIGQHVFIGPAVAAHSGPIIIIPGVATNIDHRVDRR